jgi:hypothetical protein
MKKILISLFVLLGTMSSYSQQPAPVIGELTPGSGIYSGLTKVPNTCSTSTGDFYVSSASESTSYIKWFKILTGNSPATSAQDGLENTIALLNWSTAGYNIDIASNGMPSDINAANHSNIKTPVGAVEKCFRKNYDASGTLIPGTTAENMWYLPSFHELQLVYAYYYNNNTAFGGTFVSFYHWSSTQSQFSSNEAWYVSFTDGQSLSINKAYSNMSMRVRCIRH